jgi:hypothetical protein
MGKAAAVLAAAGHRCRCTAGKCRGHLDYLYCGQTEGVIVVPVDPALTLSQACADDVKLVAMCRPCVGRREKRTDQHAKRVSEHQSGGLW